MNSTNFVLGFVVAVGIIILVAYLRKTSSESYAYSMPGSPECESIKDNYWRYYCNAGRYL